jgi:tetratricopeptide (TPR) repeat protein
MAKPTARKKVKVKNPRTSSRQMKKAPSKKPSAVSKAKSVSKAKESAKKAARRAVAPRPEKAKKSVPAAARKGGPAVAQAAKPTGKTAYAPPPSPPPRLLPQTKTTAAALALLEKGIEYIYQKDYRRARNELKTLLEAYPSEKEILARARSYIRICDREEAAQKKPPVITADQLYTLGVLEHNKANYEKAVSLFLRSLESHPEADYIYYSLAASLAMKGDLDGAMENLRKAIERNEDNRVYAKNDADFSPLHSIKEFVALVGLNPPSTAQ